MKPNDKQLQVIRLIKTTVRYWETSNDIDSPTHGIDQTDDFINLSTEIDFDSDKIDELLWQILLEVRNIK